MKRCTKNLHDYNGDRCRECQKQANKNWFKINKIYRSLYDKVRYASDRRTRIDQALEWKKKHPDRNRKNQATRRASILNATPIWLSIEHHTDIQEWYTLAKELQWLSQEPLEVDHIVPLRGDDVCGLHVPWNLQILPRSANASKSNRL